MKRTRMYSVLALVFSVLLLEIALRYFTGLGNPPLTRPHPKIEYVAAPDQDIMRFGNRIRINGFGMRSDDVDVSGKAHGNRVIVFGDSVVNGGSQTSHEDLATSLLQRDLRRSGVDAWVGNVSAGSWGPGNWKAYAQEYGFFDADVVVLVLSSHDYADNPGFAPLNPRTHPTEKPGTAIAELVFRYGPRYLGLGAGDPDRYDAPVSDAASARGLADLAAFLQLAKRQTPNVAVLHHWERSEIESGTARHGFARIRQLCETLGIPFRTMDADFRESIRTGSMPYRDNIHINERGQFLVYRNLARQVQEMQALPR